MVIPLRDANPVRRTTVVTLVLIALNIGIFALQPHSGPAEQRFLLHTAAIPCELAHGIPLSPHLVAECRPDLVPFGALGAYGASTPAFYPHKNVYFSVLASMFLHASWLHVLGNMLFLWIFGNNIEDRFGRLRYVAFYLASGVVATVGFTLANAHSISPLIGASGAIAGTMGAYLVLYPTRRILTWLPFLLVVVIPLPAYLVLGGWFVLQFFTSSSSGVAWMAHVCGFAFGMVVGAAVRSLSGPERPGGDAGIPLQGS